MELIKHPILYKEYKYTEADGIQRRSAIELIHNMIGELDEIFQMKELTEQEKQVIIKDTTEFYYEIIFRSLYKDIPQDIQMFLGNEGKDQVDVFSSIYGKHFEKVFNEYYEHRAEGVEGLQVLNENFNEIQRQTVENYSNECLIKIINYLGKDRFKCLLGEMKEYFGNELRNFLKISIAAQKEETINRPDQIENISEKANQHRDWFKNYYNRKQEYLDWLIQRAEELAKNGKSIELDIEKENREKLDDSIRSFTTPSQEDAITRKEFKNLGY